MPGGCEDFPLRVGFLGDTASQNSRSWIEGLRAQPGVEVMEGPQFETFGRTMRPRHLGADFWRLMQWRRVTQMDVLIGYRTTSYGFAAALTGFHPLVLAAQGETDVWPAGGLRALVKKGTARWAIRRADILHAWGRHMATALEQLGASRDRILVMPRGVDTDLFCPAASRRPTGRLRVTCTRALQPEYHVDILVRGLALAHRMRVPVEALVAGDGPLREELERLANDLGVGGLVRFLGRVPATEVAGLLQSSLVYVSTPETEGVSASLLEALASACVPVVTDLPGNRDWVRSGENGFLIAVGDAEAVASALRAVWERRDEWAGVGLENAAMARERASRSKNMSTFVAAYRDLASRCQARTEA